MSKKNIKIIKSNESVLSDDYELFVKQSKLFHNVLKKLFNASDFEELGICKQKPEKFFSNRKMEVPPTSSIKDDENNKLYKEFIKYNKIYKKSINNLEIQLKKIKEFIEDQEEEVIKIQKHKTLEKLNNNTNKRRSK